jgi:signal transduction histidine kinase
MDKRNNRLKDVLEHTLPWLVLAILLSFTYAKFFEHSYGFRFDPDTGKIVLVFVQQPEPTLMEGDQLIRIGSVSWEDFSTDLSKTFFEGAKPGDVVPVVVERGDQEVDVLWNYPGFNPGEFQDQVSSEWWLAYIFWMVGTLTMLLLRPRDNRWLLLSAFNFLTAIWLSAGSGNSAYHVWYSALVLRMAVLFCVPVYLHLHWIFPRPLGKLPRPVIYIVYTVTLVLAIAQGFQLVPSSLATRGFLIAVIGSLILLVIHAFRQPEVRHDLRLLLLAAMIGVIPSIILGIVDIFIPLRLGGNSLLGLGFLSLPLLPLAYFYAAYRRQLGQTEIRVNRLISVYLFMILLVTLGIPLIVLANSLLPAISSSLIIGAGASLITGIACLWGFPAFQSFIERRWLGVVLPPEQIQETYSTRITTSASLTSLLQLLSGEVLPSLLVRQFAFLEIENGSPKSLLLTGITGEQALNGFDFSELIAQSGKYRPAYRLEAEKLYPWAYLILPLRVGTAVIGFWLFGRRDPDDLYAQAEIPVLKSLANQTAIALSNILQSERLRAMYQANINRYEEERLRLALDLHDSILNQLAVLQMNLDEPSQKFQEAYEVLTQRLREIVSDLLPPMLNYGLKPAIDELAENLMERSQDMMQVDVDLQTDGTRYPPKTELHLFRIVQEACENASRHAQARNINISGKLDVQEISLHLQDDGIGFDFGKTMDLDSLISGKHFGLAGMMERAAIIGAEARIESRPEEGTRVKITWRPNTT